MLIEMILEVSKKCKRKLRGAVDLMQREEAIRETDNDPLHIKAEGILASVDKVISGLQRAIAVLPALTVGTPTLSYRRLVLTCFSAV